MGLQLVTGPATEPLSVDDVRPFFRLVHDGADSFLTPLIAAARERCERITGRALISQQWKLTLTRWPSVGAERSGDDYDLGGPLIRLPKPPLITVDEVKYVDLNGTLTTLATNQYVVDTTTEPATISPAFQSGSNAYVIWPIIRVQRAAIQVKFTAGYGTSGADVPWEIKERIKNYVAYCFEHPVERDERWLDTLFEGFDYGRA